MSVQSPLTPIFLILLFLGHALAQSTAEAMKCKRHPANTANTLTSVLVSSWDYELSSSRFETLGYLARYTGHKYAPISDPTSTQFDGLDLFHLADFKRSPNFEMFFQREARVYLFVNLNSLPADTSAPVSLRGWTSVGYARRVVGGPTIDYGVHQTLTRKMPEFVYVFSKGTGGKASVSIPQTRFVQKAIVGLSVSGLFNLWISEADGSKSPDPGLFQGSSIAPNKPCPAALHDAWMTEKEGDPFEAGKKFHSWHPAWDPCFWCSYGHEHGSDPSLLNYRPPYAYTAEKFGQPESDVGFKAFNLRVGGYFFYYVIHAQLSSLRRVTVREHTVHVVIYDIGSKEIVADFSHKADFGWQSVRLKDESYAAFLEKDVAIKQEQEDKGLPEQFRSINVQIRDNPNPAFSNRSPPSIGQYEVWETLPLCAKPKNRKAMFSVSFKTPINGIRTVQEPDVETQLGRKVGETFFRNVGLDRSIRVNSMKFSAGFCPTDPATGAAASGVFYTDPSGKTVVSGPGPNAVRQFFKPGITVEVDGRFELVDRNSGEHRRGAKGFYADHTYGIDPTNN